MSVTAGVVWATLALSLSIVPSYAAAILRTSNLALLALVAALALLASCAAQIAARRFEGVGRRDQAIGLVLLAAGLAGLVAAGWARSLALLAAGAVCAGVGHGLAFINAQQELNDLAPPERRGEVTSAFIAVLYAIVGTAVLGVGALDEVLSLRASFAAAAVAVLLVALATAAWHAVGRGEPRRRPATAS